MKKKGEIAAELKALHAGFGETGASDSTFHIPEGYFQHFPDQMTAIIQAMNADISFDAGTRQTPFEVPAGYFDQLSGSIMQKVSAMETIVQEQQHPWEDAGKKTPYHLPENYFGTFETQLMDKILHEEPAAGEEIETLSPLLATLQQKQPFAVPQGYFNSDAFVHQAQQQETKVIEHPAVRSIKWARWAAAAAVIGIFIMGGLHYLIPTSGMNAQQSLERSLAQIPDARIKDWLISNMDEVDINNLGSSIANVKTLTNTPSLNGFSEEELHDYMEAELW